MNDPFQSDLEGFGGLLILFQISLFSSILKLLIMPRSDTVLSIIFIAMIVICLIFFYRRKALFRIVYVIMVALILLIYLKYVPYSVPYIIGELIEGTIVITYLFRSERVRITFH